MTHPMRDLAGNRSMTWMRRAAMVLLVSLGGCAADPLSPLALTLRTNEAEQRWRQANLNTYSFYSAFSCFCSDEYASAKEVRVVNGVVVSVRDRATGIVRPLRFRQSIDSLFALLRRETYAGRVQGVEFDTRLGFPARMSFGSDALDDGVLILVEELGATGSIVPARTAVHSP